MQKRAEAIMHTLSKELATTVLHVRLFRSVDILGSAGMYQQRAHGLH